MPSIHFIYASTSGHTEFVVDTIVSTLRRTPAFAKATVGRQGDTSKIEKQRAEIAKPEDFLKGDILVLASSTWNTGGSEGQLNPHMHDLLNGRAAGVDLKGKKVAVIGLGDHRYHFLAKAADHLEQFVELHGGILITPTLRIINEPYGQEKTIEEWTKKFLENYLLPATR